MDKSSYLGGREDNNIGMMQGFKIVFLNESKGSNVQQSEGERWRENVGGIQSIGTSVFIEMTQPIG